jgi:hypothetical protein
MQGLTGTAKWCGGVAVGNTIYAAPYDSQSVLMIDSTSLTTDISTTTGLTGSAKWCGGAVSGTMIYFIPFSASSVLLLDTATDSVDTSTLSGLEGSAKWHGGALLGSIIYGIPYDADTVLMIDLTTHTTDTTSITGLGTGQSRSGLSAKWVGCVAVGTKIYGFPKESDSMLIIDSDTRAVDLTTVHGLGVSGNKWRGGAAHGTKLYTIPADEDHVLIVDLTPTPSLFDYFGRSVSLSSDHALVGSFGSEIAGSTGPSVVYVFSRNGRGLTREAKLESGVAYDFFGRSVSLSDTASSGEYALIGAHNDSTASNSAGAAYIFMRAGRASCQNTNDITWTMLQRLQAPDAATSDHFGLGVDLAADGEYAVVGAPGYNGEAGVDTGAAYIYHRSGSIWTFQTKLEASDARYLDFFGVSVSLSAAGDYALIGSYRDADGTAPRAGAVYVFVRTGTSWSFQAKLLGEVTHGDGFGCSVSLSGTAEYALVGSYSGSAYAFTRAGTVWSQHAKLGEAQATQAGASVSLSFDGTRALVGVPGAYSTRGAAHVFTRTGAAWELDGNFTGLSSSQSGVSMSVVATGGVPGHYASNELSTQLEPAEINTHFGESVAIAPNGDVTLVVPQTNFATDHIPISAVPAPELSVFTRIANASWTSERLMQSRPFDWYIACVLLACL